VTRLLADHRFVDLEDLLLDFCKHYELASISKVPTLSFASQWAGGNQALNADGAPPLVRSAVRPLGCDVLEVDAASVLVAIFCLSIFHSTSRLSSSIVCAIDLLARPSRLATLALRAGPVVLRNFDPRT
jgi:hypothetical protein